MSTTESKLSGVLWTVACGAIAIAGTVWLLDLVPARFFRSQSALPEGVTTSNEKIKLGPTGKVEIDEIDHNFGSMAVHEKRSHVFVLRNVGEAPVELEKGRSTCKCTLSELGKTVVAPGESTEIKLEWVPEQADEAFSQSAMIHVTNDPDRPVIRLSIYGKVSAILHVLPIESWLLGEITEGRPASVTGYLYSEVLKEFKLLKAEPSSDTLSVEYRPMNAEELDRQTASFGYAITCTLARDVPLGPYMTKVSLYTDVLVPNEDSSKLEFSESDGKVFGITVGGMRTGPIKVMGPGWNAETMSLAMGTFDAAAGTRKQLSMYVAQMGADEKFEVTKVDSDFDFIKVTCEERPALASDNRKFVTLTVEILPGPALDRSGENPAKVVLHTNHPKAPQIPIKVRFVSR